MSIKSITINGRSDIKKITINGGMLYVKEQPTPETRVKTWNLSERTEEKPYLNGSGTYILDASTGKNNLIFTAGQTDKVYWTGGFFISTPRIYNGDQPASNFSSISSVTSNGFNYTGAADHTENFMMIPYQVKAGETITWTYTRTGSNRGGYILFDSQGQYISATMLNRSGSGTTTETVSITQDGWILVCFGKYDANATVTFSDCSLNIS